MNQLLGYIYHAPTNSGTDYHYTATDVVLAVLIIVPGVIVWICILFAVPIQETIGDWWTRRKQRLRQRAEARALALQRKAERKFEPVGHSRWHGRN